MKTCCKFDVSFYRYFGDRLCFPGAEPISPLADLIREAVTPGWPAKRARHLPGYVLPG